MTDQERFRGQDPDNEFSQEEHSGQDEMSSSMGDHDESTTQGRRGRGLYSGQDESSSNMGEDMHSRRPGEGGGHGRQEDEYGTHEDEFGDEETSGSTNW